LLGCALGFLFRHAGLLDGAESLINLANLFGKDALITLEVLPAGIVVRI
jgi:hypothetical protein